MKKIRNNLFFFFFILCVATGRTSLLKAGWRKQLRSDRIQTGPNALRVIGADGKLYGPRRPDRLPKGNSSIKPTTSPAKELLTALNGENTNSSLITNKLEVYLQTITAQIKNGESIDLSALNAALPEGQKPYTPETWLNYLGEQIKARKLPDEIYKPFGKAVKAFVDQRDGKNKKFDTLIDEFETEKTKRWDIWGRIERFVSRQWRRFTSSQGNKEYNELAKIRHTIILNITADHNDDQWSTEIESYLDTVFKYQTIKPAEAIGDLLKAVNSLDTTTEYANLSSEQVKKLTQTIIDKSLTHYKTHEKTLEAINEIIKQVKGESRVIAMLETAQAKVVAEKATDSLFGNNNNTETEAERRKKANQAEEEAQREGNNAGEEGQTINAQEDHTVATGTKGSKGKGKKKPKKESTEGSDAGPKPKKGLLTRLKEARQRRAEAAAERKRKKEEEARQKAGQDENKNDGETAVEEG